MLEKNKKEIKTSKQKTGEHRESLFEMALTPFSSQLNTTKYVYKQPIEYFFSI